MRQNTKKNRFSRNQAAEHLGIHIATVDRWIQKGLLPRVKVQQSVRILKKDMDAFLKKHRLKVKKRRFVTNVPIDAAVTV